MIKSQCKKCKRKYKVLVKEICANCDPELHRSYFSKRDDKRNK